MRGRFVAGGSFVPSSAVRVALSEWDAPLVALESLKMVRRAIEDKNDAVAPAFGQSLAQRLWDLTSVDLSFPSTCCSSLSHAYITTRFYLSQSISLSGQREQLCTKGRGRSITKSPDKMGDGRSSNRSVHAEDRVNPPTAAEIRREVVALSVGNSHHDSRNHLSVRTWHDPRRRVPRRALLFRPCNPQSYQHVAYSCNVLTHKDTEDAAGSL